MSPERVLFCHGFAIATGLLTFFGSLIIQGLAVGDMAGALRREVFDIAPYWFFGLPVCYVAAGLLGYLGQVRSWRWSLEMIGTHCVATLLFTGSGLNLLPIALVFSLVLAVPGILTGWVGAWVYRFRTAMQRGSR
ncbi:MAG TPA: hypothetical protein VE597_08160 [Geminicoccaceae bacterium]|jgi:hypothetical protein|nr:hypothetical protein [Geminicoccaceae bacterium]